MNIKSQVDTWYIRILNLIIVALLISSCANPTINASDASPTINASDASPTINASDASPTINASDASPTSDKGKANLRITAVLYDCPHDFTDKFDCKRSLYERVFLVKKDGKVIQEIMLSAYDDIELSPGIYTIEPSDRSTEVDIESGEPKTVELHENDRKTVDFQFYRYHY